MNETVIDIGKQFTRYPAGRFRDDGPFSGERFRDEFLRPALAGDRTVKIVLDGTMGYGSSFLEEAFGGLVRVLGLDPVALKKQLVLDTKDKSLADEIFEYISDTHH